MKKYRILSIIIICFATVFLSIGLLAEAKHFLLLADAVVGDSDISQDIVDGGNGNLSPADLTISNATELKTFISNVRNGDDYSGKTVVLGASFEVGTIEPIGYSSYELINNVISQDFTYTRGFNGTFDGKGYTISNIAVKGSAFVHRTFAYNASTRQGKWTYTIRTALFGALGSSATICNLGIYNISYGGGIDIDQSAPTVTYEISQKGSAALFTDCSSEASFTNIKVNGVTGFDSAFGYGNGNVVDCEVINSKGIGFGVSCTTSVFKHQSGYTCSSPFGSDSSGCVSDAQNTGGLTYSSTGGTSGTVWYYSKNYNDGYPTLRLFLSWQTIHAKGVNENVTVSPKSIQIPKDATNYNFDLTSKELYIYDQIITASVSGKYSWSHWSLEYNNNERVYVANATLNTVTISFVGVDNVYTSSTTIVLGKNYVIIDGSSIKIKYGKYSKNYCYEEIEFSFTDSAGTNRSIKYTIENTKYYISGISNLNLSSTGATSYTFNGTGASNVSVTTHIKSYGATFN